MIGSQTRRHHAEWPRRIADARSRQGLRVKPLFARFAGFGAVPLFAAVVPFAVLPIASRIQGPGGWAAIGTGQAIGALVAMISSYGWNVNGGALVAQAPDADRQRELYAQSLWCRLLTYLIVGGGGAALAAALVGGAFAPVAALATLATGATGLTVAWYSVGVGLARIALWYEAIPIAVLTLASAGVMLLTGSVAAYPLLVLTGITIGLFLLNMSLFGRPLPPWDARQIARAFRSNLAVAIADGVGGSYSTAPVPVGQVLFGTPAAAQLTSADKVYRIGLTAISVLANSTQKWVLEVSYAEGRMRRHAVALVLHGIVGLTGFSVLVFAGEFLTRVFLGADVAPPAEVFPAYGLAYLTISLTTPLIRNILVPAGRDRVVMVGIVCSAIVGLPTMVLGGLSWGLVGITAGLALSEVVVLSVVSVAAIRILSGARGPA